MPDSTPAPRKSRRWLRWTLIVLAALGLAVFLLFRDEALKPADDLMPKRPVIAWDEQNGWKRMLEWTKRMPALDQKERNMVSDVIEMRREPDLQKLREIA